jgi:GNAT superfamily N-acetyltransferase
MPMHKNFLTLYFASSPGADQEVAARNRHEIYTTEMKAEIRKSSPDDAASACKVLRRSIEECCAEDHRNDAAILSAWLGNKTPETVQAWLKCSSTHSVVAVKNNELIGIATVTRQGKIVLCYVAPEARFTGAGKALLQALETQAQEWGLGALQVASTVTAKSFYSRNGFVAGGMTQTPYGAEAISFIKRLSGSYAQKKTCGCSAMAD